MITKWSLSQEHEFDLILEKKVHMSPYHRIKEVIVSIEKII